MDMSRDEKNKSLYFINKCLAFMLPFLYFIISISFYLKTYDSAQIKITLLQMGGTVLAALWIIKLFEERKIPFKGNGLLIVAPVLIYWMLGPVSWMHSPFKGTTLEELIRRMFYISFMLIAFYEVNSKQKFRILIKWILAAGFISSFYGLIQWMDYFYFPKPPNPGIDPYVWRQAFGSRIFSTHGNPNFLGNFLVILTPIILSLILKQLLQMERLIKPIISFMLVMVPTIMIAVLTCFLQKSPNFFVYIFLIASIVFLFMISVRWAFLNMFFALVIFCIIATASKGAMLGFAAAIGIFSFLGAFYFLKGRLQKLRIPVFASMIMIVIVFSLMIGQLSRKRIDSLRFRVFTWLSTIEMIQTHPIIGTGLGTFKTTYPAYRRPEIFHIEGKSNTETDHPENEFIEVLYDDGIIGFGIFIWIVILFTWLGIRSLNRFSRITTLHAASKGYMYGVIDDERAYYMLGILTAFLAMLTHNLVDVSMRFVSSGIFPWLLAGLIGALIWHEPLPDKSSELVQSDERKKPELNENAEQKNIANKIKFVVKSILIIAIGIMAIYLIQEFNVIQKPPSGQGEEKLFSWFLPWACFLAVVIGAVFIFFKVIARMTQFKQFMVIPPMLYFVFVFWGYFVADANHNMGIFYSKQAKWIEALKHYNIVIKKNPNYIMAHYFMGNVYNDRWAPGDWKRAVQKYDDVKRLAPNYVQVHHQAGMVYLKLGEEAKARGDKEKVEE
ncbi:MAG: O-antigen ligase family protein, partial [bacterium]